MFRQIAIYLVSSSLLLLLSFRHPYHVSVTTLNYNKAEKKLDIEIKAFYHDLEPALHQATGTDIDIKNHSNEQERDSLVYTYVAQHFSLNTTGGNIFLSHGKIKFKDEYIFIGLVAVGIEAQKTIQVKNTICFETEPTQTNLFHFVSNGKKITKKTVNPAAEVIFEL